MSIVFYRAPMSTATMTEIVLAELDVPHEVVTVDIQKGDTKKPDYLKINPNGKVPVIVHDGTVIWESAAITMYLGELFGVAKGLYPAPGPARGEVMKWIVWTNVTLGDAVGRWTRNTMEWLPAEQRNAKAGEVGMADLQNCLRMVDEALEGKEFLCGKYTLADAHLNSFLDWLRYMKLDFSAYARLNAWGGRCSARPGYQRVMAGGK
ncbi:MAG: glutathione S-transferase family protein [Polyangiaceae bacterium]|nr:glutathione S-transferase family protein [Polyangiaceae bacterium]